MMRTSAGRPAGGWVRTLLYVLKVVLRTGHKGFADALQLNAVGHGLRKVLVLCLVPAAQHRLRECGGGVMCMDAWVRVGDRLILPECSLN
jgi:hypothetical protein